MPGRYGNACRTATSNTAQREAVLNRRERLCPFQPQITAWPSTAGKDCAARDLDRCCRTAANSDRYPDDGL